MIELYAEDFVVKVSGSVTLLELDTELIKQGQITDLLAPQEYTINQILLEHWCQHCHRLTLGLSVIHRGIESKCGGQVIKNVSGYDLSKLYIGSYGKFGQISSAYLRSSKLTSHQIIYTLSKAAPELDLSWDNYLISKDGKQIKLWGDLDLLELRSQKLNKKLNGIDYQNKIEPYNKEYPSANDEIAKSKPNADEERIIEKLYAQFN